MCKATIVASPAAGPDTLVAEPLKAPTTMPPAMPAIRPEKSGAPEASEIPKHSGNATRATTVPAAKSWEPTFFQLLCIGMPFEKALA